ncbi:MAG TPA: argininosuccinate synthase [Thermoanaerobaculia bacterium]|nr:argininosuccinate synthase [Thermoanaerobaculia bacterium]
MKKPIKKVALAYSGGLDTSIIITWLKENYGCDVVAVAVDVGQAEETAGLAQKAYSTGACDFHLVDAKEEFAADYLFPVLKAGAIYEHDYLLGTSTARPLIARKQVEIALATGCDALAHGCTGKGNDQVRFELAYQALAPELTVIAPWREWDIVSREDAIDYAAARGIPVPVTKKDPYSRDRNLWHLSHEGGPLEDPSFEPEASMFKLTTDPMDAPDTPEKVTITFEDGVPVEVNGVKLSPAKLVQTLNEIGGRHGVGRADIVENRLIGIKSRGVYETPGGTLLVNALKALESIVLDKESAHDKERMATRYAELVYNGQWFSPLKEAYDAFVNSLSENLSGTVTLKLYKGNATVVGRKSPYSLYQQNLASFDMTGYDVTDSAGFIKLFGLQLRGRKRLSPMDVETVQSGTGGWSK